MAVGINEATLEEIKARVDLADLIASYGIAVKTAGSTKKACCPFHNEKTPSFNINERKGFYHCFGCGESGDAIKFVQKYEGLSFVDAVKKLAERCGVSIEEREDPSAGRRKRIYALLAEIAQFYHRCLLQTKEGAVARDYLASRELDGAIAEDYLIGYAPSGVANILKWAEKHGYAPEDLEAAGIIKVGTRPGDLGYHRFGGRLMFSIRDRQGRVVGFSGRQLVASKNSGKYVNSPETDVFKKSNVLYGFDKAAAAITRAVNREAIVCEGQIDCIRLQTRGFPNAVAGQGTAFTGEHAKMLKRAADQVTLVYDDDTAGHKATVKTARLCLAVELPVRVVALPGGDDPDSFLRAHPADDFARMLANAESIMAFQVRAERAKESDPDSVAAVNRIVREVLLTVAQCPNEVLKAAMIGEAAKLLRLPVAALNDELGKLKTEPVRDVPPPPPEPEEENSSAAEEKPIRISHAAPPSGEIAFMAFLLSNEGDATLDGMVGEFLPKEVFLHEFTWRFVETWRAEVPAGKDLIAPWSVALQDHERAWFDLILQTQAKSEKCALSQTEILQTFIRALWSEALMRRRGAMPASGDAESDAKRVKISMDVKHLPAVKWSTVKEIIRSWIKGDN